MTRTSIRSRRAAIALSAIAAIALASCGEDEPSAPAAAGGHDATVEVASSDLGEVLVDHDGKTLYLLLNDTDGESTCYKDCETTWPPLVADDDPVAGEGVDASKLATTERTDGTVQVTYDGMPLYHFAGDEAAGDLNGQGIGDVWYVVAPTGSPIEKKADADSKY
jgi:predicted lipoprotein with Yx(FWY)xxD motif